MISPIAYKDGNAFEMKGVVIFIRVEFDNSIYSRHCNLWTHIGHFAMSATI